MRAVFIGASSLSIMTARLLLKRNHEVVIIEQDKELVSSLPAELDCGVLHGDGTKPALLREANPELTEVLFCLTGNDQTNIIASLVGRSLGFKRAVTKIVDPEFEHICTELGLEDTIIPSRTIGRYLADMFEGHDMLELSTMVRDEARIFSFVARKEHEGALDALKLPAQSRAICIYRGGKFIVPDAQTVIKSNDEVVLITHQNNLKELQTSLATPPA
jgi:trk system potassium uptake protein TrkA